MKLRGNKLKQLRFDPSGSFMDRGKGVGGCVNPDEYRQVAKGLEKIRDDLIRDASASHPDTSFYYRPKELLEEYGRDRFKSQLATLFKVANCFHVSVDRVVVVNSNGSELGARTFLDGCCQPFWNELSRGARGSKPRIYFDGSNLDNDATQGLLRLLGATQGRIATSVEDAWGLVVIGNSRECDDLPPATLPFLRALETSCGGDVSKIRQRFIAVTGTKGKLRHLVDGFECTNLFPFPNGVHAESGVAFSPFSIIGLLPAALLGVNVIELLVGAVAMNDHFEKASAQENIILQSVAVNYLLSKHHNFKSRIMSIWNSPLASIAFWYQHLVSSLPDHEKIFGPPTLFLNTLANSPYGSKLNQTIGDRVFHNILVEDYRFDHLDPNHPNLNPTNVYNHLNDAENRFPGELLAAVEEANQIRQSMGYLTTTLWIPRIDELHLGQLLQMLMLTTTLEHRLIEIDQR